MPTLIPFVPSVGRYRFVTVIGTDQYVIFADWNRIEQAWYFDLLEYDETPIATGVRVSLGCYLASTSNHPLLQNGVLFARSSALVHVDPGFDDLGATVQVWYYSRADMIAELLGAASAAD